MNAVSKHLEADLNFNYTSSSHGFPNSRLNLRASSLLSEIQDIIKSVTSLFQACLSTLHALRPSWVPPFYPWSKMLSSKKEKSRCRICCPPLILCARQASYFTCFCLTNGSSQQLGKWALVPSCEHVLMRFPDQFMQIQGGLRSTEIWTLGFLQVPHFN